MQQGSAEDVTPDKSCREPDPSTGLGLGIGGGLDVSVPHRLALRVPQFDWTPVHAGGVWTNNVVRIGIGLVLKAGE